MVFLVIETQTGYIDGWYNGQQAAQEALDCFRRDFPMGSWMLAIKHGLENGQIGSKGLDWFESRLVAKWGWPKP
jgi:hypothetical protein